MSGHECIFFFSNHCYQIMLRLHTSSLLCFWLGTPDLFTDFFSVYNTVMKLVFIGSSLAIRSYDQELDTFRHYFLIAGCFLLALLVNEKFTFQEERQIFRHSRLVLWAFSIYSAAVSIIPQLVLLQRSGNVDNLTGQYVFLLWANRALYILNWIYRYFTELIKFVFLFALGGAGLNTVCMVFFVPCVAGLVQTALYADFFYYYFLSWKNNAKLQLPA
ncbi:unnamed protein product [Malus baccata var. baccata]